MQVRIIVSLAALVAVASFGSIPTLRGQAIAARDLRDIVGGGCGFKCQNACQTKVACGECQDYQSEGESCPGGGGGSGSAFRCVSTADDLECRLASVPPAGVCNPQKVCKCDNADPPACKEYNSGNVSGSQNCISERCPT